jgi:hypothetical protein
VKGLRLSPDAGAIVGVYRQRNAEHVLRLIEPALAQGWTTGWWGLDGVHSELATYSVGEGPGEKLPLLNRTLEKLGATPRWTVVSDDDLRFRRGDVVEFVRICEDAAFDLAQPARARGTQFSHAITQGARVSRARATSFVESGPLFVVGSRCRNRVLPLPEHRGMGWGTEIDWFDLYESGCRLGIVDATPMEHVGEAMKDYDYTDMNRRLKEELAARGRPSWAGMRETVAVWRPWRRRPPWGEPG